MSIRQITANDWPAIMAIQQSCYHDITPESLESMQSKWRVSPNSCMVYEYQNQIMAYILTHPWQKGDAPKLDSVLSSIKETKSLYIHDMAVSPSAQGLGVAKKLVNQVITISTNSDFAGIGLIAIQGARTFWQAFGFQPFDNISGSLSASLASYSDDACYMYLQADKAK
ncbi:MULTISPECIES: GNAT family N-acetyltransferase [Pseudomonadati]|uniref:GNAT family N-acetyltransferase n=1 Tax=Shewanella aestuarii TaxID=1028752 RepID=A0ABT0KZN1_9GAMM|nr:GNAT family N-acetyltransferase [Shewanella aestuarii]MCL1116882.1 GNAT family N-acetyltransferase [Shewanella aestuarii]